MHFCVNPVFWDLGFLTKDRTHSPCSGNAASRRTAREARIPETLWSGTSSLQDYEKNKFLKNNFLSLLL